MKRSSSSSDTAQAEPTLLELLELVTDTDAAKQCSASCVVCTAISASVTRALKAFFSEFVNDPDQRYKLRDSGGFCTSHLPAVQSAGDPLSLAIVYADLCDQILDRWKSKSQKRSNRMSPFGRAKNETAVCPACSLQAEAQTRYTRALAAGISVAADSRLDQFSNRQLLCSFHVDAVAALLPAAARNRFVLTQSSLLEALKAELMEIIRKNDYRYRGEEWGTERDSWLQALSMVTRPAS